jgi:hypothetical protein
VVKVGGEAGAGEGGKSSPMIDFLSGVRIRPKSDCGSGADTAAACAASLAANR